MSGSSAARWIVLTPSATAESWRDLISGAAAEQGLKTVSWSHDLAASVLADDKTLILAESVAPARAAGVVPATIILTDPESGTEATCQVNAGAFPQSFWISSLVHAEACDVGDSTALHGGPMIAGQAQFEVLPGLWVTPPGLPDRRGGRRAAAKAMKLFRAGRPTPGMSAPIASNLFLFDDKISAREDSTLIDLTGRPRILVYGPYFALPPGMWRITARFDIDEAAAKKRFRFDWGTQTDCRSETYALGEAGAYAVTIDYGFTQPVCSEFRVILMEGALDGQINFLGATVEMVGPPPEAVEPESTAA